MTNTKIQQVFIFAAGRGERMRPLTDSIPKPLVAVCDKPMLDHILDYLQTIGSIKKIIINGYYLAEQIANHLRKRSDAKIIFSHENNKLETGGGLVFAKQHIDFHQPLLTINADTIWTNNQSSNQDSGDISRLCEAWHNHPCKIMLGLKKVQDFVGYDGNGDFELVNNSLYRIPQKMSYAFVGMQIINPQIVLEVQQQCFSLSYFYKNAIGESGLLHNIKGIELSNQYYHIGTIQNLLTAQKKFAK